jgi:hypothetical protein
MDAIRARRGARRWTVTVRRLLAGGALALLPLAATAQSRIRCPVGEFAEVAACIHPGQVVRVRTTTDQEKTGKLTSLDETHVQIRVVSFWHRETVRFDATEIDTISASSAISRADGALIGALIGAGIGAIAATADDDAGQAAAAVAVSSVSFATAGWALPKEEFTVVFTRDRRTAARLPHDTVEPASGSSSVARDLEGARLHRGDDLRVRLADGSQLRGRIVRVDDRVLIVDTGGGRVREIPQEAITAVWCRTHEPPSLSKGAAAGATLGSLAIGLVLLEQAMSGEPADAPDHVTASDALVFVGFSAGVGMLATRFMGHHERAVMVRPVLSPGTTRPTGVVVQWTLRPRPVR